ncbi:hypothetical protein Rhe02_51380 [Rhizocola hellebori]|uniref:N-acetyltransferase domain-containing protein n=1 Tax=Rhizocola hellebori TaxID=1392758 RepID=A0A8J3QCT3_9ACTN|nr:GNAT family N-acetyltransferase [Rhizocola hellebori]GIH07071.1 hypothetical protein Rhe02_51380 [Rhizocola hellebori]
MDPVTLQTDGLILRPWEATDADEQMLDACNDPLIQRFMPQFPDPYTQETSQWWVTEGAPLAWQSGGASFTIREPGTDRLLGGMGLGSVQPSRKQGEVGYWIAPWARGRGVATKATRALAQWAFDHDFYRLELLVAKENPGSIRVALAAGFGREGVRRDGGATRDGGRQDLVVFVRLAGDPAGPAPRLLPDFPGGKLSDGVVEVRRLTPSDADDYYSLNQFEEVIRTHIGEPITRELAAQRCARAEYGWLSGEAAQCAIVDAASGAFAGDIQLLYRHPFSKEAMIGYSLRPEFRGKGYMTRAVNLITDWAFDKVGAIRVIAGTFDYNDASRAVLLRAGFEREGHFKAALPGRDGTRIDDIQFVRISPLVNPS